MPLLFDMPLEELKTYQGINPRPDDFDVFWDDSLAEIQSLDPEVEIVAAEFQTPYATCSHLYYTGTGGARIHAKLLQPVDAAEQGAAARQPGGNWGTWSCQTFDPTEEFEHAMRYDEWYFSTGSGTGGTFDRESYQEMDGGPAPARRRYGYGRDRFGRGTSPTRGTTRIGGATPRAPSPPPAVLSEVPRGVPDTHRSYASRV